MEASIKKFKNFFTILSFLKKAILNPEKSPTDNRILIRILMKPIIFDIYSLIIQTLDFKNVYSIEKPSKDKTSYKDIAIRHNLKEIQDKTITTTRRVELAYQIATTPWSENKNLKLLIIGCRNIVELRQATFFGFKWKNIDGADLFSTNKKILKVNMEDMKIIKDSTYDIVTMVNTLSYSKKHEKVLREIFRVLKKDGKLVFNFPFQLNSSEKIISKYSGDQLIDFNNFFQSDMEKIIKKVGFNIFFKYYNDINSKSYKKQRLRLTWYGINK